DDVDGSSAACPSQAQEALQRRRHRDTGVTTALPLRLAGERQHYRRRPGRRDVFLVAVAIGGHWSNCLRWILSFNCRNLFNRPECNFFKRLERRRGGGQEGEW